jgi:hypothetical protein
VPDAPKVNDAKTFLGQYAAVNAELRAYEQRHGPGSASDLTARYKLIRYNEAIASQASRDAASAVLAKIHADLASRGR